MDERHHLAQLVLAAHRGDAAARRELLDLATATAAASSVLDVLIDLKVADAERFGGLPELTAGEKSVVAAVVREIGGRA